MYNSGVRGRRGADGYGVISGRDQFIQTKLSYPSITGYNACNVNQVILDDTAVTPGGYMLLYGTAFTTGMTLTIGTATVSSYTLVNTGRIFLTVPITLITGTYNVSIFSSTGGGAIFTTLLVSGFPTFTQTTYSVLGTTVVNVQLLVAGDAPLTFSLGSASTLPPGVSLSGTGLLSGTISPFSGNSQTYTFNVNVDDAQAQTTTQLITLSVTLGDTYWPNNTLLLDSNTPGNVNTFVTDISLNNNIATIAGDTRPSNLNPYQAGYYSFQFPANTDYLTTPVTASNSGFSTGNFTVEAWIYPTVAQSTTIVSSNYSYGTAAGNWAFYTTVGSANLLYFNGGSSSASGANHASTVNATISLGQWTHIAYSKISNVGYFFVNGVQIGTGVADTTGYAGATGTLYIGRQADGTGYLTGYISNLRIVKGTGLYTASFTPSTTPLTSITNTSLLTCQSNINVDNSLNNYTITRVGSPTVQAFNPFGVPTSTTVNTLYSTYFDGTGDYLSIPTNAAFDFASGDFTVEAWIYLTTLTPAGGGSSNAITIITALPSSGTITGWGLDINNTNYVYWDNWVSGTEQTISATNNPITINTWYHVAVSRQSSTFRIFVNGNLCTTTGTVAQATNTGSNIIQVGAGAYTGYPNGLTGQISNLRVVKGVAVYTGTFTPPTNNLTATQSSGTNISAITGTSTSLLTCQNSTLIDNSTNVFTITSAGQAQPLAVSPFTQTTTSVSLTNLGSTYFDGTGDQLTYANNPIFAFFTNNFTVEYWLYPLSAGGQSVMNYSNGQSSNSNFAWETYQVNGTQIQFTILDSDGGTQYTAQSAGLLINRWNHIAAVRNGNTMSIYVNGVVGGTTVSVTGVSVFNKSGATLKVSGYNNATGMYTGYVEDVRIVKGTAIYTANFAPPIAQLTLVTNTSLLTLQTSQPTNNSMYLDNSSLSSLVTRAGNVAQGSFSPYGLNWSQFFPSAGATYVSPGTSTSLALGAGSFTIECWLYLNSLAPNYTTLFDWRTNGVTPSGIPIISDNSNNGTLCFIVGTGASYTVLLTSSSVMPINSWFHLAVVRSGTALAMYFNGVSVATGTSSVDFGIQTFNIGNPQATNYGAPMYVTNVRIVKGTAVYTTAFSPPTTPLTPITNTQLLAFQNSDTQIDNSPNNFNVSKSTTITSQRFSPFGTTIQSPLSYGGFFDGTGDYLSTPSSVSTSSGWNLMSPSTTGTFEAWVYRTFSDITRVIVSCLDIGASYTGWYIQMTTAGIISVEGYIAPVTGNTPQSIPSTGSVSINTWTHIAVTCVNGAITFYINGIASGTGTMGATWQVSTSTATPTQIAAAYIPWNNFFIGSISNVRMVKGVAVYTGAFTVPTTPLTATQSSGTNISAITGVQTSLLTCQSTTFIDNSTYNFTLTGNGDAKPRTFNPFGYTFTQGSPYTPALFGGSGYFDGSGDWLTLPHNPAYTPTGDFCIEFWAYTASNNVFEFYAKGDGIQIYTASSAWQAAFSSNNTTSYYLNGSGGSIVLNSWQHVATYRIGTSYYQAVNGVRVLLGTSASSPNTGTDLQYIGASKGLYPVPGYMSDVRTVIGSSVYPASNFVPPQTPLTTTTGTVLFVNMTKAGIPDYTRSIDLETVGDARLITESAYNGNYYSNSFNGTTDQLSVSNNAIFDIGANNFTIEGYMYQLTAAAVSQPTVTKYSTGVQSFYIGAYNGYWDVAVYYGSASAVSITTNTISIVLGVWNHFALVRNGANYQFFVNGTQVATSSNVQTMATSTHAVVIGGADGRPFYFPGYIADVRIVNGQALVTSAFTPSTTPLTATTVGHTGAGAAASITGTVALLTSQSNKFVDNSPNNFTVTRVGSPLVKSLNPFTLNTPTSMSFDGTGDYLISPNNPSYAFGTSNFTIEFWFYGVAAQASTAHLVGNNLTFGTNAWEIQWSNGSPSIPNKLQLWAYNLNSGAVAIQGTTTLVPGIWNYAALVRSGTSFVLYLNGVSEATLTSSASLDAGTTNLICLAARQGAEAFNGYIEDLRITKGVARYAGNFTVPTNKLPTF